MTTIEFSFDKETIIEACKRIERRGRRDYSIQSIAIDYFINKNSVADIAKELEFSNIGIYRILQSVKKEAGKIIKEDNALYIPEVLKDILQKVNSNIKDKSYKEGIDTVFNAIITGQSIATKDNDFMFKKAVDDVYKIVDGLRRKSSES